MARPPRRECNEAPLGCFASTFCTGAADASSILISVYKTNVASDFHWNVALAIRPRGVRRRRVVMDGIDKTFEKLSVTVTPRPAERIVGSAPAGWSRVLPPRYNWTKVTHRQSDAGRRLIRRQATAKLYVFWQRKANILPFFTPVTIPNIQTLHYWKGREGGEKKKTSM